MGVILGSARVSRAGDGVLAIANFSYAFDQTTQKQREVRFGATPKLARETQALPNHRLRVLGLGSGVGRGLGVVWGLGVGVGLGVTVAV